MAKKKIKIKVRTATLSPPIQNWTCPYCDGENGLDPDDFHAGARKTEDYDHLYDGECSYCNKSVGLIE